MRYNDQQFLSSYCEVNNNTESSITTTPAILEREFNINYNHLITISVYTITICNNNNNN